MAKAPGMRLAIAAGRRPRPPAAPFGPVKSGNAPHVAAGPVDRGSGDTQRTGGGAGRHAQKPGLDLVPVQGVRRSLQWRHRLRV